MQVQRSFIIGDQWLYYKIYTGTKTADYLLSEVLLPLVNHLKAEQLIDKWFFIRYADPEHHIRIRFRFDRPEKIGSIINIVSPSLKTLLEQELIWKIQTDTYQRELERYGANTIEQAETIFQYDSEMIVQFIDMIDDGSEGSELRWLFAIRGIDAFLADFAAPLAQRLQLLKLLKEDFAREFHMNKYLKKQVNDRYRDYRERISNFMALDAQASSEFSPILNLLTERKRQSLPAIKSILGHQEKGTLAMNINELFASYIHMFMNRLFKSKNRLHEMIGYDFLFRHYMAVTARQKIANSTAKA